MQLWPGLGGGGVVVNWCEEFTEVVDVLGLRACKMAVLVAHEACSVRYPSFFSDEFRPNFSKLSLIPCGRAVRSGSSSDQELLTIEFVLLMMLNLVVGFLGQRPTGTCQVRRIFGVICASKIALFRSFLDSVF